MKPETPPLPQIAAAPAPPPLFGQQAGPKKKGQRSAQPSFLGTDTQPAQGQLGTKTLLGQ